MQFQHIEQWTGCDFVLLGFTKGNSFGFLKISANNIQAFA